MLGVNLTRMRSNYYAQHGCHGVSLQMGRECISLRSQMPRGLRSHNRRAYTFNLQHRWTYFRGSDYNPNPNQVKKEEYIYVKTTKASTDAIPANPWANNGVSILLHYLF